MKRSITSLGILLTLILVCFLSLHLLRTECTRYAHLAELTETACVHGDIPEALAAFDRLERGWGRFHDRTGLVVDGEKLDAIRERLTGLRPLIERGCPEATAELERIRQLITDLFEEELPELWHIL